MQRSGVVDGILVAAGVFLLLQTIGGIRLIATDFAMFDPLSLIIVSILPAATAIIGTLFIRAAYRRRKKRQAAKSIQEQTPIGVRTVSIQKQRKMPGGVAIIAGLSIASGVASLFLGPLAAAGLVPALDLAAELLPFYGALVAVTGIASIIIAYGIFTKKRWAWFWGVIGLFVSAIWAGIELNLRPDITSQVTFAAGIVVYSIMIYYMYRPHVRAHFGKIPNKPA